MSQMTLLPLKVFCYSAIYLLCQVILSHCEVTLVTRAVKDSFRIGKDGCLKNKNVCTKTVCCDQGDGSCLCNDEKPHFRNPIIIQDDTPIYGNSYGCITNKVAGLLNAPLGIAACNFKPFQVIPNDEKETATKFEHKEKTYNFETCNFISLEAKFPNNNNRSMVSSMKETYVELTMSGRTLSFKWMKSVPMLQGSIITINLRCKDDYERYSKECLQAKVLGTWRSSSAVEPTDDDPAVNLTCSYITSTTTTISNLVPPFTTSPNNTSSSHKSHPDVVVITVAVVVPLIVLIIVILVASCFIKRRQRNKKISKRSSSQENNDTGCANTGMSYRNDDSTPDIERVMVNEDMYAVVNNKKNKQNDKSASAKPQNMPTGAAPNVSSHSEYATPDIKRVMVNGDTYAVVDKRKKRKQEDKSASAKPQSTPTGAAPNVSSHSEYATPDIERVMVNGDTYAVVDKRKKPKQELNYMDPENLDLDKTNLDAGEPSVPTQYASIAEVM